MSAIIVLLLVVCLLPSSEEQGSNDVTRVTGSNDVTRVFVQNGKDVRLDVRKPDEDIFSWIFSESVNIVTLSPNNEPKFYNNYLERAEFFAQNYSLLLKNVQHKDSGVYTAQVLGGKVQTLAEYTIIVKDPVSPVHLTVNPISSDPCNLTVTCRAEDSHITSTFTCDNQTCSQEGRERSGVTIDVYVQQDFIICNHSNQVSWKDNRKEIKVFCRPQSVSNGATIAGIVIGVILVVVCFIIFCLSKSCKRPTSKREKDENTVYAVPEELNSGQTPTEVPSGLSPTSTYDLVRFHTGPVESTKTKDTSGSPETVYAEVEKESTKTKDTSVSPETVYAQVEKAPKSSSRPPSVILNVGECENIVR